MDLAATNLNLSLYKLLKPHQVRINENVQSLNKRRSQFSVMFMKRAGLSYWADISWFRLLFGENKTANTMFFRREAAVMNLSLLNMQRLLFRDFWTTNYAIYPSLKKQEREAHNPNVCLQVDMVIEPNNGVIYSCHCWWNQPDREGHCEARYCRRNPTPEFLNKNDTTEERIIPNSIADSILVLVWHI